jgi:hypothetical protein
MIRYLEESLQMRSYFGRHVGSDKLNAPKRPRSKFFTPSLIATFICHGCGKFDDKPDVDPQSDGDSSSGISMPHGGDALGQGGRSGSVDFGPLEGVAAVVRSEVAAYDFVRQSLETAFQSNTMGLNVQEMPVENRLENQVGVDFESDSLSYELGAVVQSSVYPSCSSNGEPWDSASNARMDPTKKEYSQWAFYCQLNAADSLQTVRGALDFNRRLFCDVEKTLGSVAYAYQEKTYASVTMGLTPACGWTAQDLKTLGRTQLTGEIKTQAFAGGDWQKKLTLDFPSNVLGVRSIQLTLYVTVTKNILAFKEIQDWKMKEEKDANQYIAQSANGHHGHVILLDFAAGTLRAESVDSYWGRRVRLLAKGVLDTNTGRFKSIDGLQGLYGKFNKAGPEAHTYVENAVASVKGTASGGFAYLSGTYYCPQDAACNPNNNELFNYTILNQSKLHCVPLTSQCSGNQGVTWSLQRPILDFLMVGAAWDDQGQKRIAFENWLSSAGHLKFDLVDFNPMP